MQKRARLLDNKMKRIHINRRGRTEYKDSLSLPLAYIRLTLCWLTIVTLGAFTGVRIELLWPFWLMIRAAYESMQKNHHPVTSLTNPNTTKFSVFFVCVTATSDLICYLFIPVRMLIFIATTYVWINLIWHTHGGFVRTVNTMYNGEKSQSGLILVLTAMVIGFELFLRVRFDYYMQINRGDQGSSLPIFWTNSVSPALPRGLNGFFASHCIGYPVVLVTFSLQYYFREWQKRRVQNYVSTKNELLLRLLVESLPAEYEGPKDYLAGCIDDDCYFDTAPIGNGNSTTTTTTSNQQPMAALTAGGGGGVGGSAAYSNNNGTPTQTTNSKKNGYNKGRGGDQNKKGGGGGAKKNGNVSTNNGTTMPEKKTKDGTNETNNNGGYDSDDECCWNGSSSKDYSSSMPAETRRKHRIGAISLIRVLLDFSIWIFSGLGSALIGSRSIDRRDDRNNHLNNNGTSKRPTTSASRKKKNCEYIDENSYYEETEKMQNGRINASESSTSNNNGSVSKSKINNQHHHQNNRSSIKPRIVGKSAKTDKQQEVMSNEQNDIEIYTREIEDLRCELSTKRNIENDLKLTIRMLESNDERLSQTISHLRMRLDQMENKCNSLEKHRETDKSNLEQADAKYTSLLARKVDLEQALIVERKARNEDTGKKMDLTEHQREKERQLEKEVDRLRAELKVKEESNTKYEVELATLRRYREANDIDEIRMETKILKDKSSHLEASLASENKLKQELFRALGDAKASNKCLEKRVNDLEAELRSRPHIVDDDTTNSDQSSPHQNNSAMGSPIPPTSTKSPLSINIMNRETPKIISPIGSKIGAAMVGGLVGIQPQLPPDYKSIMQHSTPQPPTINNFSYRYNQFQPHSSTGEHMLFDTPPAMQSLTSPTVQQQQQSAAAASLSATSCAPSDLSRHMGKFGAPSNPITRTN